MKRSQPSIQLLLKSTSRWTPNLVATSIHEFKSLASAIFFITWDFDLPGPPTHFFSLTVSLTPREIESYFPSKHTIMHKCCRRICKDCTMVQHLSRPPWLFHATSLPVSPFMPAPYFPTITRYFVPLMSHLVFFPALLIYFGKTIQDNLSRVSGSKGLKFKS